MSSDGQALKYMPFSSLVDTTFWHILCKKKLDQLKLDEQPFPATAVFRNGMSARAVVIQLNFFF